MFEWNENKEKIVVSSPETREHGKIIIIIKWCNQLIAPCVCSNYAN